MKYVEVGGVRVSAIGLGTWQFGSTEWGYGRDYARTEAIKILLGRGTTLSGRLVTYDSLKMKFRELRLRRSPQCPVCGPKPTITSYIDYEGFCATG